MSECGVDSLWSSAGFMDRMRRSAVNSGVPMSGSMELTDACNLDCVHCYVVHPPNGRINGLRTDRIKSLLDEVCEAGCLTMLLTGGEPMLRKDFPEIYRHARLNGLMTTVFTNAVLINPKVVELFQELPPRVVEVSVYGASRDVYETVTKVRGSYDRCLRGIEMLLAGGVPVKIKTVMMTLNKEEVSGIQEIAERYGVSFHFDAAIFPRLDGDRAPLAYRVPKEEVLRQELKDPELLPQWRAASRRVKPDLESDKLYQCGAASTGFHITAQGTLQPCLITKDIQYDLQTGSFLDGWAYIREQAQAQRMTPGMSCRGCDNKNVCGYCPAIFKLESKGGPLQKSQYICDTGQDRRTLIDADMTGETSEIDAFVGEVPAAIS